MAVTLGQRIQELRKQNGLSQEALGEALGVSRQAVSKWEGDNGIPELDTLIAMSRLFGIPVGELLGVEEPSAQTPPEDTEARLEAILQRYTQQQTAQTKKEPRRREPRVLALAAGAAILVFLFVQFLTLRSEVRNLRSQLSSLEVRMSGELGSLSGYIRGTIYEVLEEQNALINTFDWRVEDADFQAETADVLLKTTLKAYGADSQVQFVLRWTCTDETMGDTVTDWVSGPDFAVPVTLPMNYQTEVTLRVKDAAGNILEQPLDTIHDLHPDRFSLEAYNLLKPFAITGKANGITSTTAKGEDPYITIASAYPHLIWPEKAVIRAIVNGETVFAEEMSLSTVNGEPVFTEEMKEAWAEGKRQAFCARLKDGYYDMTLYAGDELLVQLDVIDNLGRAEPFIHGGEMVYVKNHGVSLEQIPVAAPTIPID